MGSGLQRRSLLIRLNLGMGVYQRMKIIMMNTIQESRHTMFEQATKKIELELELMALGIKKDMIFRTSHIKKKISSDYQLVAAKLANETSSSVELDFKANVLKIVASAEAEFEEFVGCEENASPLTSVGNDGEEDGAG